MDYNNNIDQEYSTASRLALLVRAEKLQLLFKQSFPAIFGSLATAGLLCIVLWPVQNASILIFWFLLIVASTIMRLILFIHYWRAKPQEESVLAWEKPYYSTLLISALIWGGGALFIISISSPMHQVLIYSFLIGMSGGAIGTYLAHRSMTLITIACVLFPATGWFFLQGHLYSICIGMGSIIFFTSAVFAGKVLSSSMHQSFILAHQLNKARETAEKQARMDVLTGLNNRRAFYESGRVLSRYCQRKSDKLCMILMDIDYFKKVNDTYGHLAGDAVLQKVGMVVRQSLRSSDVPSRIGGDEFAILLATTTLEVAATVAQKIQKSIAETPVIFDGNDIAITTSFGVVSGSYDIDKLFKCADAAMYQAKNTGRNKVIFRECSTE